MTVPKLHGPQFKAKFGFYISKIPKLKFEKSDFDRIVQMSLTMYYHGVVTVHNQNLFLKFYYKSR